MIYAKANTYGVDKKINLIQRYLDAKLATSWGNNVLVYGRVQDTIKDGKQIPEVYDGIEYINPFINDNQAATIAFIEKTKSINVGKFTSQVDVLFTVLLPEIHSNALREDEKAIMQAYTALKKSGYALSINGVKQGINDVFSGYDTSMIIYRDMQPWLVFSFQIEIDYTENLC